MVVSTSQCKEYFLTLCSIVNASRQGGKWLAWITISSFVEVSYSWWRLCPEPQHKDPHWQSIPISKKTFNGFHFYQRERASSRHTAPYRTCGSAQRRNMKIIADSGVVPSTAYTPVTNVSYFTLSSCYLSCVGTFQRTIVAFDKDCCYHGFGSVYGRNEKHYEFLHRSDLLLLSHLLWHKHKSYNRNARHPTYRWLIYAGSAVIAVFVDHAMAWSPYQLRKKKGSCPVVCHNDIKR